MRELLALLIILATSISGAALVSFRDSAPTAADVPITFTLVERNINSTEIDLGDSGPSAGDMIVWGPNPFYDEANEEDTGAKTEGVCITTHVPDHCVITETVVFSDNSSTSSGAKRSTPRPHAR